MTEKDEKILESLKNIQDFCKENSCDNCPLSDCNENCLVRDDSPNEWKINTEKKIKYLM